MKICRITAAFPPPWEGLGPGPYELSLAQAKLSHHITVITKYSPGCESLDKETHLKKIYRIKAKRNLTFGLLAAIKFFILHWRERYDVVHSHGESAFAFLLLKRVFFVKVPVVTSVHIIRKAQFKTIEKVDIHKVPRETLGKETVEMIPSIKKNRRELVIEKLYLKLSDRLVVVSEALRQDIKNEYNISNNVSVILNGVNTNVFRNDSINKKNLRKKISLDCEYLILFVGVLNGRKGEFDLIKAMKKVCSEFPDAALLIIGNGPTKEVSMKVVKNLKLEDNIKFISNLTHSEIKRYYMACDLFVLPSYSEGLPKVLLEAMASGIPVIASDIPAHQYIIKDNVTGYLFKTGNINDLASTVLKALKDDNTRKMISSNAKILVEKKYSWKGVTKRLDHIYKVVIRK